MKSVALAYHDVVKNRNYDSSGFRGEGANHYKLDYENFDHHLRAFAEANKSAAVLADSAFTSPDPPNEIPLFLTFDDGGVSALSPTCDLLETCGCRGHFFITTNYIGKPGFVRAEDVREMRRRGHLIGSHSCSHPPRMSALSYTQMVNEWRSSNAVLSDILGEPTPVASVPGGYFSRQVAEAASEAGIKVLFNSEPGKKGHFIDGCLVLPRYSVYRSTPAQLAVKLVSDNYSSEQVKQYVLWNTKKVVKALGGTYYLRLRERLFAQGKPH